MIIKNVNIIAFGGIKNKKIKFLIIYFHILG